jgi:spore coat protein U-like protein
MSRMWGIGALLLVWVAVPVVPTAQSRTANLTVSASVVANCIVTAQEVAFGAYDPIGANRTTPLDAVGSVTLTCTRGTSARVTLSLGRNPTGATRRMANGSAFLAYELFADAGRANSWTRTAFNPFGSGLAPSNRPFTMPVYGRVPAGQNVPLGAYTDEVLVVVTF